MYHFNNEKYKNPGKEWAERNQRIASLFDENKSVLDLGCGYKNLLKYYTPSNYLGVDWFEHADITINLNDDFVLPAGWDYVVSSGVLEYLDNVENYLTKIKELGNTYIFTWRAKEDRYSYDEIRTLIEKQYIILSEDNNPQRIYVCKSK